MYCLTGNSRRINNDNNGGTEAHRSSLKNHGSVVLISWFWHFVDAVWIVVFSVV